MKWPPDVCTFCGSTKNATPHQSKIEDTWIDYFKCDACADNAAQSTQTQAYHQGIIRGKWELQREKESQS